MIETPQILENEPIVSACVHLHVPREQIRQFMGPGLAEVMDAVRSQGLKQVGPWFTHHHSIDEGYFDLDISVPVETPPDPFGNVKAAIIPSQRIARTIYHGPYEGLGEAWGEFMSWIEGNGYKPAKDLWEVYLSGSESGDDPLKCSTELNRPLL